MRHSLCTYYPVSKNSADCTSPPSVTPGIPRLMPSIASEAVFSIKTFFPQEADDWIQINAFQVVLNSVTQVSARLFVGEKLCRDPEWLKVAQKTAMAAFGTTFAISKWPAWTHPITSQFLPEYQELQKYRAKGISMLKKNAAANLEKGDKGQEEDYLYTWIAKKNPKWVNDFKAQADLQLELSVAAIHTTTMALTHMLYDTAAHPEYIQILRDEIKAASAQNGGEYNRDCILKMIKVDSFMKESQRLHPPGFTSFQRIVLKTFTLSDGTVIPKGVMLNVDGWSRYRDAENWENPDQFDGLRFMRLREQSKDRGNHQYLSSNSDYVSWGQGKHACPGMSHINSFHRLAI